MYIGGMLACNIVCVTLLYVLRWTFFIRSETRFNDLYRCEFFPGCAAWYSTLSTLARQLQTRVASAACVEGVHNRPPPTAPHAPPTRLLRHAARLGSAPRRRRGRVGRQRRPLGRRAAAAGRHSNAPASPPRPAPLGWCRRRVRRRPGLSNRYRCELRG
jgi:hypothetical protein